jgi:sugar lactone lactonase YvrE
MVSIEPVSNVSTKLGENPLWDVEEQRLYWVDAVGHKIFRAAADGRDVESWDAPAEIGSMCLRKKGGAVVALDTGLHFLDFKTGRFEKFADPEEAQPAVRLNDCKVDKRGRMIVGSYDRESYDPARPGVAVKSRGSFFRVDPDLSIHTIETGIACCNGPCWSPDEKRFYFADTMCGQIFVADWNAEKGTLSNKRTFQSYGPEGGMPDGATVDAEGFYWSAFMGPGELRRYAPGGTLDRTVKMPILKASSLIFGGPDLDTIYVTTMDDHLPPPDGPMGGRLFAVRGLGIRGLPEPRFGG